MKQLVVNMPSKSVECVGFVDALPFSIESLGFINSTSMKNDDARDSISSCIDSVIRPLLFLVGLFCMW